MYIVQSLTELRHSGCIWELLPKKNACEKNSSLGTNEYKIRINKATVFFLFFWTEITIVPLFYHVFYLLLPQILFGQKISKTTIVKRHPKYDYSRIVDNNQLGLCNKDLSKTYLSIEFPKKLLFIPCFLCWQAVSVDLRVSRISGI